MAPRQSPSAHGPGDGPEALSSEAPTAPLPSWMSQALEQGLTPERALACLALGLLGSSAGGEANPPWIWSGEEEPRSDLTALRQRLEVIQLAVQTGAPLTTAEVSQLLGARPGSDLVERGGLRARRVSRNVWKLSRSGESREGSGSVVPFSEGFRRRL